MSTRPSEPALLTFLRRVAAPTEAKPGVFLDRLLDPFAATIHLIGIIRCWGGVPAHIRHGPMYEGPHFLNTGKNVAAIRGAAIEVDRSHVITT